MSVRRVICLRLQVLSGSIDGISRDSFVFKMRVSKSETAPLRFLLGRRRFSAASGGEQYFQFSWHQSSSFQRSANLTHRGRLRD
jgi:hypothetical protein